MSLKRKAVTGAYWLGAGGVIGVVAQFGTLMVLARLLEPRDFGLVAMVSVVIGLAQVYADLGVGNAIIHRQDTTAAQLSSLYWLNILAGVVAYLLLVAATPLVVLLYGEPRLAKLVPLAALILLISSPGAQFRILLQKELRFRALAISESIGAASGAGVAIASALAGHGLYAIVFGSLANHAVTTALVLAMGWREWPVRLTFQRKHLTGYIGFGLFQMGERTANYVGQNLGQLLIGVLIGAQALGYYNLAIGLVYLPLQRINPILTRVAFPMFAKLQDNTDQLKRGFMIMRGVLAAVNFPLFLGLAGTAPILVPVLFGEQWLESVVLIQILSLVAMLRSTGNPVGSLLLAKGRADYGFYWNLFTIPVLIPFISAGAYFGGAVGVATAVLVAQCLFFGLNYLMIVRRLIGPCFNQYLNTLAPAALSAGIMAVAVLAIGETLAGPASGPLVTQVVVGAGIYFGLYWLFFRSQAVAILRLALGRDT